MFKLLLLVVVAVVGVPVFGSFMIRCDGSLDAALERVRACPAAADALGAGIDPSFLGLTCGGGRSGGPDGGERVAWETPVKGHAADATLEYVADKVDDEWRIVEARLWIGDAEIHVVPCGAAAAGSSDALACDQGDGAACNRLGVRYAAGLEGEARSVDRARQLYERACAAKNATGCANLGALHERDLGDPRAAASYYRLGCEARSPAACAGLGALLADGRGVARDEAKAVALLGGACDDGHAPACGRAGALIARGRGVPADPRRGAALTGRGCDAADQRSCVELASLYAEGLGIARDEAKAVALWRAACDGGLAAGCARLGRHFEALGRAETAAKYLRRACAAGHAGACPAAGD
ncbi:MAG: hypothetical protein CSA66_02730 [Proteobacteria bacterium]|nr:MAG: hypothetical protein CSA66_02730 [Pseudomonadota bacterium]